MKAGTSYLMTSKRAWLLLDDEQRQAMNYLMSRVWAHQIIQERKAHTQLGLLEEVMLSSNSRSRHVSTAPMPNSAAHGTVHVLRARTTSDLVANVLSQQLIGESSEMPKLTKLDWVYKKLQRDPDFKHLSNHANFVPGEGPHPNPAAILIGEAPGAHEDKLCRPFVGQSGNMLEGMMWDAGLKRSECFITNVVKWRPPSNRAPTIDEVEYSIPYLRKELMAVMPNGGLVILLGSVALSVADQTKRVMSCHGEPFTRNSWIFMPMAHPSYVLQGRMPRDKYQEDWHKIKKLLAA